MAKSMVNWRWFWLLEGALILGVVGDIQADEPQPKGEKAGEKQDPLALITVSKETTRITEPLKPNGMVDYAAALNARLSEGITPETNAGVLLMQAIGSADIPKTQRFAFYKALGIAAPQETKGTHEDYGQFVKQQVESLSDAAKREQEQQTLFDHQSQAMSQPWSRKQFPVVANWVDANANTLELAVQASQQSRLFLPIVVEENQPILASALNRTANLRSIARLLTARAMLAVEEGRIEEAQSDLLACHHLARLLGQQPTMIETLVSYAIDATALQADRGLAESKNITPAQLAAYRKQLQALPALPKLSETIDQGERFMSLDAICHLATNSDGNAGNGIGLPNDKLFRRMLGMSIDWDLILKRFNEEYDKIVAALKLPSYAAQAVEMAKQETELNKLREEVNKPAQLALMFLGVDPPRAVISRQMGNVLLSLLIPAVRQMAQAEFQAETRRNLTVISLALDEYQREQGQYPEQLTNLSPKYLKTIPVDRFTDKLPNYKRQDGGYLLYSLGPNGQDDEGQSRETNPNSDDWAIRTPRQPE